MPARVFSVVLMLILSLPAHAEFASFDSLSDQDVETIVKEFSANLVHTSVTAPTGLGKNFGAEVSLVGGIAQSPGINEISKRQDPNAEVPFIPHGWLNLGVTVPFGISFEVNYVPDVDVQSLTVEHMSAAVKWSITDQFFSSLPFDLAVRTYYGSSQLGFTQILEDTPTAGSDTTVAVSYKNKILGAETLFGYDFGIIEPYAGIGFVQSDATLSGTATADPSFSMFVDDVSQTKNLKQSSARILAGFQLNLAIMKISMEYSHLFAASRFSAKVGLAF